MKFQWNRLIGRRPEDLPVITCRLLDGGHEIKSVAAEHYSHANELSIQFGWFVFANAAFVAIPKCACTSIKMAFAARFAPEFFSDFHNSESIHRPDAPHGGRFVPWEQRRDITQKLATSFCVLRDPIERFVSFWKNKIFRNAGTSTTSFPPALSEAGFAPGMSLGDCVDQLFLAPVAKWDRHIIPQYFFLHRSFGKKLEPAVSHVLRFECLERDWAKLADVVEDLPPLPPRRLNQSGQGEAAQLRDSVKDKLRDFYRGDFELLAQTK